MEEENQMRSWVNLGYLTMYVCLALIQFSHPPVVDHYPYVYIWVIAALSYPFCLGFTGQKTGFWKGLLIIVAIPALAQLIECVVYLLRTNGFRNYDYDSVVLFGFYLIGPLGASILWYPLGYLAYWLLARQFPAIFIKGTSGASPLK
jgi:hypothetical protein